MQEYCLEAVAAGREVKWGERREESAIRSRRKMFRVYGEKNLLNRGGKGGLSISDGAHQSPTQARVGPLCVDGVWRISC